MQILPSSRGSGFSRKTSTAGKKELLTFPSPLSWKFMFLVSLPLSFCFNEIAIEEIDSAKVNVLDTG